ncbi:hypothetical protein FE391_36075 [Nonomuraea sp. KC401]|uniref:hypothetical protein n=1 Tax=unclassified Nonomuraea TaxID=2593643 RepID=UPI0010FEA5C3|nr:MULTISPECIES: hypothetical protein [unclassified Nonomuraea]NBE97788.1 hypothetical protein [Nonomuraea sp. K271]TLF58617.1 hypothetical protein FE391_36075 [Nonomuraea sp. KC401]
MSNGARHALGVLAGLLLPPLIVAGLSYGVGEFTTRTRITFEPSWLGLAVVAAAAIAFAFLVGSRLSPVASLLGGLLITALGVLPIMELITRQRLLPTQWLPPEAGIGFQTLAQSSLLFFLGVTVLVVSMFPSRWRAADRRPPPDQHYEYGPDYGPGYGPDYRPAQAPYPSQSGPEDATRPMFRE